MCRQDQVWTQFNYNIYWIMKQKAFKTLKSGSLRFFFNIKDLRIKINQYKMAVLNMTYTYL